MTYATSFTELHSYMRKDFHVFFPIKVFQKDCCPIKNTYKPTAC